MAILLIILLGTVLIQGSSIAAGDLLSRHGARGDLAEAFRNATFTLISLTLASLLGYGLMNLLRASATDFLRTPVLLLGTALVFYVTRLLLERVPGVMRWPNTLAHLSTQVALFGMALFSATYLQSAWEALRYGFGAAVLLAFLNAAFNALRSRVDEADVPYVFRGIPVALITAGFMALALMGFLGLVRH